MQREEALRNGDYVKAEILNRPAEKYIGTVAFMIKIILR